MILRRDDAFMAICELLTPIDVNTTNVGTGMFVSSPVDDQHICAWIVTANHVARATNDNTLIVVSTKEGMAQKIPLKVFGGLNNWRHHPIADISAFLIQPTSINVSALSRHGKKILSSKMLALSKQCKHFEWDCQVKAICCA